MAKKKHAKKKGMGFAIFMVVYALVALVGIGFGLKWLWGCMEAYEASRPHIPVNAYMNSLTKEHILDSCDDLLEGMDPKLQDEKALRQYLLESISGELNYARKASACTETEQVYVVRADKQVLGTFSIRSTQEDEYGFTPWEFAGESFDLSHLITTETLSVTVPEGYFPYVNGVKLDDSYIVSTESSEYKLLEDFYGKYELPMFVLNTYEVKLLQTEEIQVEFYDETGRPFVYDETFDPDSQVRLSDEAVTEELKDFVEEFLDIYVIFAGCANDDRYTNYSRVIKYMVPDSDLAKRMKEALDGMQFAQSRGDEVDHMEFHDFAELAENTYMVDVTYYVNTTGREGVVQTTTNVKMIIVRSGSKLLVESMMGY